MKALDIILKQVALDEWIALATESVLRVGISRRRAVGRSSTEVLGFKLKLTRRDSRIVSTARRGSTIPLRDEASLIACPVGVCERTKDAECRRFDHELVGPADAPARNNRRQALNFADVNVKASGGCRNAKYNYLYIEHRLIKASIEAEQFVWRQLLERSEHWCVALASDGITCHLGQFLSLKTFLISPSPSQGFNSDADMNDSLVLFHLF
jgi:hypothetical protein